MNAVGRVNLRLGLVGNQYPDHLQAPVATVWRVSVAQFSKLFDKVCSAAGLRHIFTRPYTPKTNGKAERFIQTMTRSWAYGRSYDHSKLRKAALPDWLHRYNWHRPHHGINLKTPISILGFNRNNLLLHHS